MRAVGKRKRLRGVGKIKRLRAVVKRKRLRAAVKREQLRAAVVLTLQGTAEPVNFDIKRQENLTGNS